MLLEMDNPLYVYIIVWYIFLKRCNTWIKVWRKIDTFHTVESHKI